MLKIATRKGMMQEKQNAEKHRALRLESNQHSILPISVFFIPPSSKHYPKTSAPRKLISERGFQKTAWIGPELGPTCERGSVGARAKTLKQPRLRVAPHRTEGAPAAVALHFRERVLQDRDAERRATVAQHVGWVLRETELACDCFPRRTKGSIRDGKNTNVAVTMPRAESVNVHTQPQNKKSPFWP